MRFFKKKVTRAEDPAELEEYLRIRLTWRPCSALDGKTDDWDGSYSCELKRDLIRNESMHCDGTVGIVRYQGFLDQLAGNMYSVHEEFGVLLRCPSAGRGRGLGGYIVVLTGPVDRVSDWMYRSSSIDAERDRSYEVVMLGSVYATEILDKNERYTLLLVRGRLSEL